MTNITPKVGDKLIWLRQGAALACEVLAVRDPEHMNGNARAELKIKGWMGTHWETIDYTFAYPER